jgi:Ulp1 family protease
MTMRNVHDSQHISRLWLNDFREQQPELAEQVHVFSSFFYKKLSVKE